MDTKIDIESEKQTTLPTVSFKSDKFKRYINFWQYIHQVSDSLLRKSSIAKFKGNAIFSLEYGGIPIFKTFTW